MVQYTQPQRYNAGNYSTVQGSYLRGANPKMETTRTKWEKHPI